MKKNEWYQRRRKGRLEERGEVKNGLHRCRVTWRRREEGDFKGLWCSQPFRHTTLLNSTSPLVICLILNTLIYTYTNTHVCTHMHTSKCMVVAVGQGRVELPALASHSVNGGWCWHYNPHLLISCKHKHPDRLIYLKTNIATKTHISTSSNSTSTQRLVHTVTCKRRRQIKSQTGPLTPWK